MPDLLLLQPALSLEREDDEVNREYWAAMGNVGSLGGDLASEPNLGLLYLAAVVKDAGWSVEVVDFHAMSQQHIRDVLSSKSPRYVGITCMTFSSARALTLARMCRTCYPEAPIILGGVHPTAMAEEILENAPEVDYIVCGEGEVTLPVLLSILERGGDPSLVRGIALRDQFGKPYRTPSRPLLTDLDSLPFPNYESVLATGLPFTPRVLTARGCFGMCSFCSQNITMYRNKYRCRRPAKVVDEVQWLRDSLGCNYIVFGDLTFMAMPQAATEICNELIRRDLGIQFWCQTRADLLTPERAQLLKRAGCVQVALGIESVVDNGNKGTLLSDATAACKAAKDAGLNVQTYWIIGMPHETFDSALHTIDFMGKMIQYGLTDVTHISVLVPYPGTPLWEHPEEHGIKLLSRDYSEYLMNCDSHGYGLPVYETQNLSRHQIYALWELALATAAKHYRGIWSHINVQSQDRGRINLSGPSGLQSGYGRRFQLPVLSSHGACSTVDEDGQEYVQCHSERSLPSERGCAGRNSQG